MTKTLKQILIQEKLTLELNPEYGTDKGGPKSYVEKYYEEKFLPFKNKHINIVEIGVRSGASICLWKNYFSNAIIYGLDDLSDKNNHNILVNDEWILGENIHYVIGDAYTEKISNQIKNKIDILIDDGPHTLESHNKLIDLYLPKMKKGGIIIIEDISYNPELIIHKVPNSIVYDFGGYDNRLIEIKV
jgi:predicted O-methyltransferase YrrM